MSVYGSRAVLAEESDFVVALVGRIDNVEETRRSLGWHQTADDRAQLFLAAWRRWGKRAVDHLVGSYAGAILDRTTCEVTLFRDLTAGVPVYLASFEGQAIATSELSVITSLPGWRLEPSPAFLASCLQNVFPEADVTPYVGVSGLAPGHVARWSGDSWQQEAVARWHVRSIKHSSMDDYVDEFAVLLDQAVACRLEGHGRVGISLSGGLDSTNVLAAGVRVAGDVEWTAYGIPFSEDAGDERRLQAVVAAHCGAGLRWVSVDGRGPMGGWSGQLFAGHSTPHLGGNWYFFDSIAEAATADGAHVIYDGEDADSLLSMGRGHLADLFVRGRWASWWHEAHRIQRGTGISLKSLLHFSARSQLPGRWAARLGGLPKILCISPIVSPELAARAGLLDQLWRQPEVQIWSPGRRFRAERRSVGSAMFMNNLARISGAAFDGLDIIDAHPFQDRRLMTFCMGLPWQVIIGDGRPKWLLRELAQRRLPEEFNAAVRKARLNYYYRNAVFGHEKAMVMNGLDVAARHPELVNARELPRLRYEVETGGDAWMPSRVAMIMLWVDQLERGTAADESA